MQIFITHIRLISVEEVYIHPTAFVDATAKIGAGSKIWHFVHIRDGTSIGKNVIVGKSSYIGLDVILGDNVKIQNLVSVFKGVILENNVFVGPHVAFTNDMFPRANGDWELCETLVKENASIGANTTIICGIIIGRFALIGAGSVITKNVPDYGLVFGNPGKLRGYVCECAHKFSDFPTDTGTHELICGFCDKNIKIIIE